LETRRITLGSKGEKSSLGLKNSSGSLREEGGEEEFRKKGKCGGGDSVKRGEPQSLGKER